MKKNQFNQELKALTQEQLQEKLEQLRRDLFSVQLNAQTAHVKDNAQFGLLKKNIARVLTVIAQKEAHDSQVKQ